MGIWDPAYDLTDVNATCQSHGKDGELGRTLALGDDYGNVKLFRYPCAVAYSAEHVAYGGHSSHVTCVQFSMDDSKLFSTGGCDTALFQWKFLEGQEPDPANVMEASGKEISVGAKKVTKKKKEETARVVGKTATKAPIPETKKKAMGIGRKKKASSEFELGLHLLVNREEGYVNNFEDSAKKANEELERAKFRVVKLNGAIKTANEEIAKARSKAARVEEKLRLHPDDPKVARLLDKTRADIAVLETRAETELPEELAAAQEAVQEHTDKAAQAQERAALRGSADADSEPPVKYQAGRAMTSVFAPSQHVYTAPKGSENVPEASLELHHVYGYNGRTMKNNIFINDAGKFVYPIAATAVVLDFDTNEQKFFSGHNEDITCMAMHPGRVIFATGQSDPAGLTSRGSGGGVRGLVEARRRAAVHLRARRPRRPRLCP